MVPLLFGNEPLLAPRGCRGTAWGALQTEEQRGCDLWLLRLQDGVVLTWVGCEANGILALGREGSWISALKQMVSDSGLQKSFGLVSQHQQSSVTMETVSHWSPPLLKGPSGEAGPVGL